MDTNIDAVFVVGLPGETKDGYSLYLFALTNKSLPNIAINGVLLASHATVLKKQCDLRGRSQPSEVCLRTSGLIHTLNCLKLVLFINWRKLRGVYSSM